MARTVGFSIRDEDAPRLQRLTEEFGSGSRSDFLRQAMDVMERYARFQALARLQAYGEERAHDLGVDTGDMPAIVHAVLAADRADVRDAACDLLDGLRLRYVRAEDVPPAPARDAADPVARSVVDGLLVAEG